MKWRASAVKFALFAGASILVTGTIWNTLQNSTGDIDTARYFARFDDASGLHEGDVVRVAGVRAGRVDKIELKGRQAQVEFDLDRRTVVGERTRVAIKYQNLLGQRYLGLYADGDPGTRLQPGAVIPASRTEDSLDLTLLLNGFQPLLTSLDPADVNSVAQSLVEALQGEGPQVESFLTEFSRVATEFDARDEAIGDVLTNLTPVLQEISDSSSDVDDLVKQTDRLMHGLAKQRHTWGPALERINDTATDLARAGVRTTGPVEKTARQFNATAGLFLGQRALLTQIIREFPAFADSVGRLGLQGGYISVYPCHVDANIPGLFPSDVISEFGGHKHTAVCK